MKPSQLMPSWTLSCGPLGRLPRAGWCIGLRTIHKTPGYVEPPNLLGRGSWEAEGSKSTSEARFSHSRAACRRLVDRGSIQPRLQSPGRGVHPRVSSLESSAFGPFPLMATISRCSRRKRHPSGAKARGAQRLQSPAQAANWFEVSGLRNVGLRSHVEHDGRAVRSEQRQRGALGRHDLHTPRSDGRR
jgi:hypothetical protein